MYSPNPIIINCKLQLVNILVNFCNQDIRPTECKTANEFKDLLNSQKFSSIEKLYIPCKLTPKFSLNLTIKHGNLKNEWDVFQNEIPLLSFNCDKEQDFIQEFWEKLRGILSPSETDTPVNITM
jgi:hypothetical protein